MDGCLTDPYKIDPGNCACGNPEMDLREPVINPAMPQWFLFILGLLFSTVATVALCRVKTAYDYDAR